MGYNGFGEDREAQLAVLDLSATWSMGFAGKTLAFAVGLPLGATGPSVRDRSAQYTATFFMGNPRVGAVLAKTYAATTLAIGIDYFLSIANDEARDASAMMFGDPARTWPYADVARFHLDGRLTSESVSVQGEIGFERWLLGGDDQTILRVAVSAAVPMTHSTALIIDASSYNDLLDENAPDNQSLALVLDSGLRFNFDPAWLTLRLSVPVYPSNQPAAGADIRLRL